MEPRTRTPKIYARITGTLDEGYTIEFNGQKESGFETLAEAKLNADEIEAGKRVLAPGVPTELPPPSSEHRSTRRTPTLAQSSTVANLVGVVGLAVLGLLGVLVWQDGAGPADVTRALSPTASAIGTGRLSTDAQTPSQKQRLPQQTAQQETRQETQQSRNIKTVSKIVADYHKAHTYVGRDIFVCGDMASDVWNMLITKGINARIMIGDVEKDISSVQQASHAWVIAEVSPGGWLALETTGGFVVYSEDNSRYYRGHTFSNPKELRAYSDLRRDLAVAKQKFEDAMRDMQQRESQFARAGGFHPDILLDYNQSMLLDEWGESEAVVDQRIADMVRLDVELQALCGD